MKKTLLFACGILTLASTSFAQGNEIPNESARITGELLDQFNRESMERRADNQSREEIDGWVSFELTEYEFIHGPDAFYTYGQVITSDSLPRVSFSGGVFSSFTQGFGQIFDPTAEDMEESDSRLTASDPYTIDSIGFPCIYRRVNHNDIDDTLVITIAVTDKEDAAGNPYDGSFWWTPTGLLAQDTYVISPSYTGSPAHGYQHGLTGVSDAGSNVEIQQLKFALTDADTEILWRSFPVDIDAGPDQIVYTFVEFKPSFVTSMDDTAFVFDGAVGEANTNSFRTIYDYPVAEETGYFFDLYREGGQSYNASYVSPTNLRYAQYEGDDEWRNSRLEVYSWWGFRFEYYMNATSSVGLNETEKDEANFDIYPNPANGNEVIILSNTQILDGTITLRDVEGRVLYNGNVNGNDQVVLDPSKLNLSAGVYMVTLTNANEQFSRKLVVK